MSRQAGASKAAQKIDRRRIALIHVAKAQVGMSDEDYRAMLESVGVSSSVDLTIRQFDQVMRRFKAGGFEGRQPEGGAKVPSVTNQKRRLVVKMDQVLKELALPWSYADGMARQMFGVDRVRFLEVGQLYKVLQALMVYHKRGLNRKAKQAARAAQTEEKAP